ncbi:hypothetical protein [Butyrivibrio sp. YAB3001]|nr:hypothetical protein [Butyrivibrio sp. YAB3001]SFC27680.1 hypothetical protein SAMN02910398_01878 [Butyrivibrio sp. YAB3001]
MRKMTLCTYADNVDSTDLYQSVLHVVGTYGQMVAMSYLISNI